MSVEMRPWHILIVEDNIADICLLRLALQDAGLDFEMTVLKDGGEALDYVERHGDGGDGRPDLAILDHMLPKNDGAEVLRAIRSSEHLGQIPVVIMTSLASPYNRVEIASLGINRQLVKPSNLEDFRKVGAALKEMLLESRSD